MNRLESKFTSKFKRWVFYRWAGPTAHFELKIARGKSLAFDAVSDKQKGNLRIAQKKFVHKYSDFDRMGTPFDMTVTVGAESYVVIQFDKPKNKEFYICPINVFLDMEKTSGKKKSAREELIRDRCRLERLG